MTTIDIEELKKVEVGPNDVILLRVELPKLELNELGKHGPYSRMMDAIKEMRDRAFPNNELIILSGKTQIEVLHAEPDYEDIAIHIAQIAARESSRR